jgi:hypothetical protein
LQRAWDKNGEATFEFVILELCEVDELLQREQHHIDAEPRSKRYNATFTAGRIDQTPEMRAATAERSREFFKNPDNRKRVSERTSEYWSSSVNRENASKKIREVQATPEYKERHRAAIFKPEAVAAMSARSTRTTSDPAWKERHSKQHSETMRKLCEDPAHRKRLSDIGKMSGASRAARAGYYETPEFKARVSAAGKASAAARAARKAREVEELNSSARVPTTLG